MGESREHRPSERTNKVMHLEKTKLFTSFDLWNYFKNARGFKNFSNYSSCKFILDFYMSTNSIQIVGVTI